MELSDKGILELAESEGIVPAPYFDSVGVMTYGIGHTASAGGPDPSKMDMAMPLNIDDAVDDALALFRKDVVKYVARVNKAFPVTMAQHQFDALVSWDFNTGGASWRSGSGKPCQLVQQVNAGDFSGDGFMGWLKPPEIKKRRTAERNLFRTGDYDANGTDIPIWKTDGNGRLAGLHSTIDGKDLLSRMGRVATKPTPTPTNPFAALFSALAKLFGGTKNV